MCPYLCLRGHIAPIVAAKVITDPGVLDLAQMVMVRCDMLAACTEEPGRITRRYGTPALAEAQGLVSDWMRKTGLGISWAGGQQ